MAASRRRTAAVAAMVFLATACGSGTPPPSGSPTPSTGGSAVATAAPTAAPTATPSPTPTPPATDPATIFAADGIGPYRIGGQLTDLTSRSLLTGVTESPLCADTKSASATGRYSGLVTMTFIGGKLVALHTNSTGVVTPSGGKVGMALTDLQSIYGGRGSLITGTHGNKALSVRVPSSPLAIVFFLDASNTSVASMSGGEAERLETAARTGEGC